MQLAILAADFTPGEADRLRRAMAAWKRKGGLGPFHARLVGRMVAKGYAREYAERIFQQIEGFGEYGFPESHAASFALLVWVSAWLKCRHPDAFLAALLNSQPMGFYAPAQLVRDARQHGVEVRPIDVHRSDWLSTIEPDGALRLGMRLISGLGENEGRQVCAAVERRKSLRLGSFQDILSLWRASGVRAAAMRRLAAADAFGSLGLTRQKALWHARRLRDEFLPLFDGQDAMSAAQSQADRECASLPAFSDAREVSRDYAAVGLSLRNHPIAFIRAELHRRGLIVCADLLDPEKTPNGAWIAVAGFVLVRQRPGTAEGVTFMTLEDETGVANIVVWRQIYDRYRRAAGAQLLIVRGRVQREQGVVHVIAARLQRLLSPSAPEPITVASRNFR